MNAPEGFRKAIPARVKVAVVKRQNGLCGCGCRFRLRAGHIEYDHVPQLAIREWDEKLQDTIPQSNDPEYIVAKTIDCHARKSFGSKATTAGSDANVRAKIRHIQAGGRTRRGPPIKSKGFSKTLTRHFDGTTEARR